MREKITIPSQELRALAQNLVDAESPNPPGDVSLPLAVAVNYLEENRIPFSRVSIDAKNRKVNLVARVLGEHPGPHLVMNAHLDVFPMPESAADSASRQSRRLGAAQEQDVVRGRGAVDMKSGAAVFMVIMKLLNQRRQEIHGQATLCLVCDEETFGPYGSRALLELFPELAGDALLSTEPSSLSVVRVGERGFMWGTVEFIGKGGHGAYPGGDQSPIEKAAAFITALREAIPEDWGDVKKESDPVLSQSLLAPKGKSFVDFPSVNFGTIGGGIKVNMQADRCLLEVDIRVPLGQRIETFAKIVTDIAARHGGTYRLDNFGEPNKSDESDRLFAIIKKSVEDVTGNTPSFAVGLGCTDARLWRYLDVPAAVYGPDPSTMAKDDEAMPLTDLVTIASVHLQTAREYLGGGASLDT
jgi:succinyl-diaminopimelate desuccinylase